MRGFKKKKFRSKTLKELILQLQQAINMKLTSDNYNFLTDLRFKVIAGNLDYKMRSSPGFYLTSKRSHQEERSWFTQQSVELHNIEKIVDEIVKEANFQGHYTTRSFGQRWSQELNSSINKKVKMKFTV